jgi:putative holliday junction resolvase
VKNYLGIDYGSRRIGLAIGNDEAKIAHPYKTLQTEMGYFDQLAEVIKTENIAELVVGLPRTNDGKETDQTREARFFAAELASFKLPIHLQDEAGTTGEALRRGGKPKVDLDSIAAAIILQDYLDAL